MTFKQLTLAPASQLQAVHLVRVFDWEEKATFCERSEKLLFPHQISCLRAHATPPRHVKGKTTAPTEPMRL